MKLGTKIIMGFLLTCAIFMALSAYIIYAMLGVQSDVATLREETMPENDRVAALQSRMLGEAVDINLYEDNGRPEVWQRTRESNAKSVKDFNEIIATLTSSDFLKGRSAIQALAKTAQANYADYETAAIVLPDIKKRFDEARDAVRQAYENMTKACMDFRQGQQAGQTEEIDNMAGSADLKRRAMRIAKAADMETEAGNFYIFMLRGLFYKDLKAFDTAIVDMDKTMAIATELRDDSRNDNDKRWLQAIINASAVCKTAMENIKKVTIDTEQAIDKRIAIRAQLSAQMEELGQVLTAANDELASITAKSITTVFYSLVVGVLAALAVSIVVAIVITRGITRPVHSIIGTLSEGPRPWTAPPPSSPAPPTPWPRGPRKTRPAWKKPARPWRS